MPLGSDRRERAHPRPNAKLQLPALLRDYFEYVRGNPEICDQAPIEYLDLLWRQANEFAKRNGVRRPVWLEEIQALRAAMECRRSGHLAELPSLADRRQAEPQGAMNGRDDERKRQREVGIRAR